MSEIPHGVVALHCAVFFSDEVGTAGILVDGAGIEQGVFPNHSITIHPLLPPTSVLDHPVPRQKLTTLCGMGRGEGEGSEGVYKRRCE